MIMEDGQTVQEWMKEYASDPFFCDKPLNYSGIILTPQAGYWEVKYQDGHVEYYSAYTGNRIPNEQMEEV